jgi:hypothetical protein
LVLPSALGRGDSDPFAAARRAHVLRAIICIRVAAAMVAVVALEGAGSRGSGGTFAERKRQLPNVYDL